LRSRGSAQALGLQESVPQLRIPLSARRLLRLNHVLAILLLAVDCAARAWRIQLATWAAGGRLSFRDALRLNLYGEAASTLTPNRLGGEPARFLGMTWSGLRVVLALVALGVEVAAEWPVFGAMAVALAAYYVPDWSEAADRFLTHSLARDLLGFELIALVVLLPSGGGGIEVAFLSGFAGDFGAGHQLTMLLLWRFYTTVLLTVLGVYLLIRTHGAAAAKELFTVGWFRRR